MKRRLLIALAALLGLILIGLILAPGFARRYLEKHSREYLGRKFTIEHIRVNYLTATVRLKGFKLHEQDEKEIFVSFDKLLVNLQPFNLLRNEIVIEKLHLTGLYSNIIQSDSSFNFDDIIEFLDKPADSSETVQDTTPSEPWRFRMYDFKLVGADFAFDDRNVGKVSRLRDFSLEIPYIAWGGEDSDADLKFNFDDAGYFEAGISLDTDRGDYKADVRVSGLRVEAFREYLAFYSGIQSVSGIFNCQVDLNGNINNPAEILLAGKIWLQDPGMTDAEGDRFIAAERVDIGMKHIDYLNNRFEFDSIILTAPYVHFVLHDSTNNFAQAFMTETDTLSRDTVYTDSVGGDPPEVNLFYSVDAFFIRNGSVDYTDYLTDQPFDYHLTEITLEADSITTDMEWVNLYASMLLNNRGTLQADLGFNPVDPVNNLKLDYVISDFLLTDLNIYSRFYMGFPILLGDMYYKSETSILEGQLTSENKLVMTNVELGEKGGGLYDIPIRLALFILKDRNGIINLDVPVRGDLNDPKVRLGRIIWNTFRNLIVKVATSPFDALAGQLGADPKDLEAINFNYADTVMTAQRKRQLDLLIRLEQQKPGLGIQLVYFNDVGLEIEAIRLNSQRIKDEEELLNEAGILRDRRISAVQKYLHDKNPLTGIEVSESEPADPKNVASPPVFQILYSLEEAGEPD